MRNLSRMHITSEHLTEDWRPVWRYVEGCIKHKSIRPSEAMVRTRFPWVRFPEDKVMASDLALIHDGLIKRLRYKKLLEALEGAARVTSTPDDLDAGIEHMEAALRDLNGTKTATHLTDPMAHGSIRRTLLEGRAKPGIKTGFASIDSITGGYRPNKLYVVAGRPGQGKSFIAILACAKALMEGKRMLFYSLEMTPSEVSGRLYSILGSELFGMTMSPNKLSKSDYKAIQKIKAEIPGKLHLSDPSAPCTLSRIEADVETIRPDLVWVDYITLMRMPRATDTGARSLAVRDLSAGLKGIALRFNTAVGYCAQLNREAEKNRGPYGLEHLASSDGIGMDADFVMAIRREGEQANLQVLKNRSGPMIFGDIPCDFYPEQGLFRESEDVAVSS